MGVGRAETVAFLFTDIEGSTELVRSDPDVYGQIVAEHARLVRAAVADHGGSVRDQVAWGERGELTIDAALALAESAVSS